MIVLNNAFTKWIPPDGTQLSLLGKTEERRRVVGSTTSQRVPVWYFHLLSTDGNERFLRVEMGGQSRAKRITFVSSEKIPEWILDKFQENDPLLETPVENINPSINPYNCLKKTRINTLGQLVRCSERDLLAISKLGPAALQEIVDRLSELGLELKSDPRPPP